MKCLLLLVHLLSSSGRRLRRQDEWEQQPLAEGAAHWDGAEPSGCGRDLLSSVLDNLPVEAVATLVEKSMPPTRCSPDGCELGSDVASGIFATCQAVGGTINPVIGLACGLGDKVAKTHKKVGIIQIIKHYYILYLKEKPLHTIPNRNTSKYNVLLLIIEGVTD